MHARPSHRTGVIVVVSLVWLAWLAIMASGNHWILFKDNWFMTVTMCFGSFIAGATSEGGGAVAFPVMTLIFGIAPHVARDFSLMIQSIGMTAATALIVWMGIRVEWRAILWAGLGGTVGVVIGLELVSPWLPATYTKMFFTSLWLSFGGSLLWINRHRDRLITDKIKSFEKRQIMLLVAIGMVGGTVSGIIGSGLDIVTFTFLTLFFRISEKIATPTSVVLMAGNAVVGAVWHGAFNQLEAEAWNYWYVCVPVVVVGAPLGAHFINKRTRHFISRLLIASIVVQFLVAILIVPQTPHLLLFSLTTFLLGAFAFYLMSSAGALRLSRLSQKCERRYVPRQ